MAVLYFFSRRPLLTVSVGPLLLTIIAAIVNFHIHFAGLLIFIFSLLGRIFFCAADRRGLKNTVVADIQKELDAQKEACQSIQAEIRAERESLSKERESQMAEFQRMSKELEAQVGKITGMQKELESQKENLIVDVAARTFVQHRKLSPNIDSEMIKEAIASLILAASAFISSTSQLLAAPTEPL